MTTTTALIIGILTGVVCTLAMAIFAISWGAGTAEKDFEKNDEYE